MQRVKDWPWLKSAVVGGAKLICNTLMGEVDTEILELMESRQLRSR